MLTWTTNKQAPLVSGQVFSPSWPWAMTTETALGIAMDMEVLTASSCNLLHGPNIPRCIHLRLHLPRGVNHQDRSITETILSESSATTISSSKNISGTHASRGGGGCGGKRTSTASAGAKRGAVMNPPRESSARARRTTAVAARTPRHQRLRRRRPARRPRAHMRGTCSVAAAPEPEAPLPPTGGSGERLGEEQADGGGGLAAWRGGRGGVGLEPGQPRPCPCVAVLAERRVSGFRR